MESVPRLAAEVAAAVVQMGAAATEVAHKVELATAQKLLVRRVARRLL